jgi:hypothetical protein
MKKVISYIVVGVILAEVGEKRFKLPIEFGSDSPTFKTDNRDEILDIGKTSKVNTPFGEVNSLGGVLSITQQTIIEVDGDEFVNEKSFIETFGNISENEINDLQGFLLDRKLYINTNLV